MWACEEAGALAALLPHRSCHTARCRNCILCRRSSAAHWQRADVMCLSRPPAVVLRPAELSGGTSSALFRLHSAAATAVAAALRLWHPDIRARECVPGQRDDSDCDVPQISIQAQGCRMVGWLAGWVSWLNCSSWTRFARPQVLLVFPGPPLQKPVFWGGYPFVRLSECQQLYFSHDLLHGSVLFRIFVVST